MVSRVPIVGSLRRARYVWGSLCSGSDLTETFPAISSPIAWRGFYSLRAHPYNHGFAIPMPRVTNHGLGIPVS